ncbi:hypothetical protein G3480_24395 [Thiorhodococcus mannitoliphagus]|uniref:Uncharacterized protein n=1 Tax=Thiorhodococcus mannitoliphagus TaxID=329406 RepID=A0A6P1E780_9GAMM|nr:hypothetical protein [Thiorhodococcus mannitoliphagus]NEX23395.1 hypothetical protein [Thiorhodococcus mannitoliphagus]
MHTPLTPSDALLLALSERWLSDLLPPSVRDDLQADFDAAREALAAHPAYASWLNRIRVFEHWDDVLQPPDADQQVADTLQQALLDEAAARRKSMRRRGA